MAGIGFELRSLLRGQSFFSLLRGYGYAAIIGSGPCVLSILAVIGIGLISAGRVPPDDVRLFLVSVTYLMAGSLVFTGLLQFMFTRFIADQLFQKLRGEVTPNLVGALGLTAAAAGLVGTLLVGLFFGGSLSYRLLMVAGFVMLSQSWVVIVMLSGLKEYRQVLAVFVAGYSVSACAATAAMRFGAEGLLAGFLLGQALLLYLMLVLVVRAFPARRLVSFAFLGAHKAHYSLIGTGFLYNFGIWADKLVFWMNPATSEPVVAPLRTSLIYDVPIFLAYLSIVPGMAVFLVRVETDFAERYDAFYKAVREGETLSQIERLKAHMTEVVRLGIGEILRIQGLTILVLIFASQRLLPALGISLLYRPLFCVYLVGTGLQVLMLAVLNVLFYLDQRGATLALSALFVTLNVGLTLLSQRLGPSFYGYGFAVSTLVTGLLGMAIVSRRFARLEYQTFMLQR
jgi:uncharacterized membrane protein